MMMISVMWEVWEQRQGIPITQNSNNHERESGKGYQMDMEKEREREREAVTMFVCVCVWSSEKRRLCLGFIIRSLDEKGVSTYHDALSLSHSVIRCLWFTWLFLPTFSSDIFLFSLNG